MVADPTPAERREWATSLLEGTTPGPWTAERFYQKHSERIADGWRWGIEDGTGYLATLPEDDESTARSDGRLIAAAPDLAAAVRDLADENRRIRWAMERSARRTALAEAERDAARAENAALREALSVIIDEANEASSYTKGDLAGIASAALSNPQPQTAAEDQQ